MAGKIRVQWQTFRGGEISEWRTDALSEWEGAVWGPAGTATPTAFLIVLSFLLLESNFVFRLVAV